MNRLSPKLRIFIGCCNLIRDLNYIKFLKNELEVKRGATVIVVGSLAEIQRTYYLIHKYKPHIVILPQIQEKAIRDITRYIKKSGGIVCVVPSELAYSSSNSFWLFNKKLSYNDYVDFYFIPGEQMYKDIIKNSDISEKKLFIVGSPKMDLLAKNKKKFLSRKEFCYKYLIPPKKKNIFIFTTFYSSPENYIKKEEAFRGNVKEVIRIYQALCETKKVFLNDIKKLCKDFPNSNIIVKPHPLENPEEYKKINADNYYCIDNEALNNTLDSIDLAIHWNSTVATECWLKSKKTLQYVPINNYADLLSDFQKGNPVIYNYQYLVKAIEKYLHFPLEQKYYKFQKKYISLWYYKVDGKSANRIAQILGEQVKNCPTLNYKPQYNRAYHLLAISEKLLGVYISRKLISFLDRNYAWQYAVDNYLLMD
jgi:surface carbohydrate biosynthesis protein